MSGARKESSISSSSKGPRQLAGIALLLLCIGLPLLSLVGSLTISESPEVRDSFVERIEIAKDFEFPPALRELALREMKFTFVYSAVAAFFFLSPLLISGLRFLTGPDHILWSWQQNRIKRHPRIAYLFLVFGIGASYRFFQRVLNPMNRAQMLVLQGGTQGKIGFLVAMLICLAISLWLYIGKKNPISGRREKTEAEAERPHH